VPSVIQVLKIGGSLLTDKTREQVFDGEQARRLADEVAAYGRPLVLVHGTGSFGKPPARQFNYMDGFLPPERAGVVSAVDAILDELRNRVMQALRSAGVVSRALSPAALFRTRRGEVTWTESEVVRMHLDRNISPVIAGGFVVDEEWGFAVLSSDQMAARLAVALGSCRLIIATDVPGVMDPDGGLTDPTSLFGDDRRLREWVAPSVGDVSGGMRGKLDAGLVAVRAGSEVHLVDGRVPGRVHQALTCDDAPKTRLVASAFGPVTAVTEGRPLCAG